MRNAEDVLGLAIPKVVIATGARWRRDGVGRWHTRPIAIDAAASVLTPDDVMGGRQPEGRVLVWDDDHYYMGGVLAELFAMQGHETLYLTPASEASTWTRATLEQQFIQARLLRKGVSIQTFRAVTAVERGAVEIACVFTGARTTVAADTVVLVTARLPQDDLALELESRREAWTDAGVASVAVIGDALAPATIAHATYAGRRYAEECDAAETPDEVPFRREIAQLAAC